jgi:Cu+-exporting ATPase
MHIGYQKISIKRPSLCYHCGEQYTFAGVKFDNKGFCCDGCKMVYELLQNNNLCTYYNLNNTPGVSQLQTATSGKYTYLDNEKISNAFVRFRDGSTVHITWSIPKMHCSSCIWLLENLPRLNNAIISSSVNFLRKEVTVIFNEQQVKLSDVAALLAHIGYEPAISLNDLEQKAEKKSNKEQIIKIGLAGFCFGNIMMLSFPEYFSSGNFFEQQRLSYLFGYLNLALALPVFFYCASDFFVSAWKSIRHNYLNIDAPIALAISVTFVRSIYEITMHSGAGYLDSMSGIVFFMLIGRYFQNFTYDSLSFERDYKSYFPVGVTVKHENGIEENLPVSELKKSDKILIHHNELIPSDSVLISERTHIDYSFITGESAPVVKHAGDLIYAGGKQIGGAIVLEVLNQVSQSYLTQLWNKKEKKKETNPGHSLTDKINKYFTVAVLSISMITGIYWWMEDVNIALSAMTAVLIVACPCGLLLTTTFANGNVLRILGRNKFYLKNSGIIGKLIKADMILFDKTGTITNGSEINFVGRELKSCELKAAVSLAAHSSHPLSRKIYTQFNTGDFFVLKNFVEVAGNGIQGKVDEKCLKLGSEQYIKGALPFDGIGSTNVFFSIDNEVIGYFKFTNSYRKGLTALISKLLPEYDLKLLSGDNDSERKAIEAIFGKKSELIFNQKPEEKMHYIQSLQQQGRKVIMIGDGLNDAGALKKSDVGIAVSDDTNNFSPACDAILDGSAFSKIPLFINLAKASQNVIFVTFTISLAYNLIGLSFAVQGVLSPVIAAILMPISSISIVLLATLSTSLIAKIKGL